MRSMNIEKDTSAGLQYDDFGVTAAPPFTPQRSFSSTSPYQQQQTFSPSSVLPVAQPYLPVSSPPLPTVTPGSDKSSLSTELDLNDPSTLEIYSRILLFKDDRMRDELAFSRTLTSKQRRVVHLVAQKLGVYHYSVGEGEERYAVVTRIDPNRVSLVLLMRDIILTIRCSIGTTGPTPHLPHPFACAFCLLVTNVTGVCQCPPSQEVYARYEDFTYPVTPSKHAVIEWQHPGRLCYYCIPVASISRWFWLYFWEQQWLWWRRRIYSPRP